MSRPSPTTDLDEPFAAPGSLLRCATTLAVALLAVLVLAALPAGARAEGPAPLLARSPANTAVGSAAVWDLAATDVTYSAAHDELWVLEGHLDPAAPSFLVFPGDASLATGPRRRVVINASDAVGASQARALGIAAADQGDLAGSALVLLDLAFDADPRIVGLWIDAEGQPASGLAPIDVIDPAVRGRRLSSIDIRPDHEQIAAYDLDRHEVLLLSFDLDLVAGPFSPIGDPGFFVARWTLDGPRGAGAGIAFQSADRLWMSAGFSHPFDVRFALEYSLDAGLAYTGRAVDLSASFRGEPGARVGTIVSLDIAPPSGTDVTFSPDRIFALDFSSESVALLDLVPETQPPPARILDARIDPEDARWLARFAVADPGTNDSIRILANGVTVDEIPPGDLLTAEEVIAQGRGPTIGSTQLELVSVRDGVSSALTTRVTPRASELEGADLAPPTRSLPGFRPSACSVTPRPGSLDALRLYVLGTRSNEVRVFGSNLERLGTIQPLPRVDTIGNNLAASGIALVTDAAGNPERLAILDPDGPAGNNAPELRYHSLSSEPAGRLLGAPRPIDLSPLFPTPFLLDIDAHPAGGFVASAILPDDRYALVRLEELADRLVGVALAVSPHQSIVPAELAPRSIAPGIGVCVLDSGALLVAGSDTTRSTYAEALLVSALERDLAPRRSGFAFALPTAATALQLGEGIGPSRIHSLDVAFVPDALGVPRPLAFVPVFDVELTRNPASRESLRIQPETILRGSLLESSRAIPLAETEHEFAVLFDEPVALPSGSELPLPLPILDAESSARDLRLSITNLSAESAEIVLSVHSLEGETIDRERILDETIRIPAGRTHRRGLDGAASPWVEIRLRSATLEAVSVPRLLRVLVSERAREDTGPAPPSVAFLRSDCNSDGSTSISDALFLAGFLFLGSAEPRCADACDANDDGELDITDVIQTLSFLFLQGPAPLDPGLECGRDPSPDALPGCDAGC